MLERTLIGLAISFGLLSLQAVGGGTAVLPEMQRVAEDTYHISQTDFSRMFALGQVAPGPNMTMVALVGYHVAGMGGALVVLFAFFVPASILCFWAGRLWEHIGETPWRRAVQDGLAPISIGLMASGVYAIGRNSATTAVTITLALAVLALMLKTRINPSLLILACGVFGGFFLTR